MYNLINCILNEITDLAEGLFSYWVVKGKKIFISEGKSHADIVIREPQTFNLTLHQLTRLIEEYRKYGETTEITKRACESGAAAVTYDRNRKELNIRSKEISSGILDSVIEFAPGEIENIVWETNKGFIEGTPEYIYNKI